MLEENLESLERRLRGENQSLTEFYTQKIEAINSEKNALIAEYDVKLKNMQENVDQTFARLKAKHQEEVESLTAGHKNMIENIR